MPNDAKEGSDQSVLSEKVVSAPPDLPALTESSRARGVKVWLTDLSQRAFWLTVISGIVASIVAGIVTGILVWRIQEHFAEQSRNEAESIIVKTIKSSVLNECRRLQSGFASLYEGYPTVTCDINVYHLPKPDPALKDYLNARREAIVASMDEKGAALIRSGALAAGAYDRIFSNQYFQSVIFRNTTTFDDYFRPLNEMCAIVDVKLSIQQCPYER